MGYDGIDPASALVGLDGFVVRALLDAGRPNWSLLETVTSC